MIIETELIHQLTVENIKGYLKSLGGVEKTSKFNNKVTNWKLFDNKKDVHIITVIEDNTYDDYELRIQELLAELSKILNKDKTTICKEIINYSRDIVKFHIRDPTAPTGTLSLEHGTTIFESIKNIFISGAASANDIYNEKTTPLEIYSNKKVDRISEYKKQLKIGQSEIGSYVITISTEIPRPVGDVQSSLDKNIMKDSFERSVNLTINNALSEFKRNYREIVNDENNKSNIISKSFRRGLSVNLCEAISDLGKIGDEYTDIDIECDWAKTAPVPKGTPSKISLTSTEIKYMEISASRYRESNPTQNYAARGYVYLLDREKKQEEGYIGMIVNIKGRQYRLKVKLSYDGGDASDYHQALIAHTTERPLQCVGTLIQDGTTYKLLDPHDVKVLNSNFNDE